MEDIIIEDEIIVRESSDVEKFDKNNDGVLKKLQLDVPFLKNNVEEYFEDDEKYMDLLYSMADRSGVERVLKMRFLLGKGVSLRDILWRSGKNRGELEKYIVKFRKYGIGENEKGTQDNVVRELSMANIFSGTFGIWSGERFVGDGTWQSLDNFNLKLDKSWELYFDMTCGNSSEYFFQIDIDDTLNFMNFLIDIIYEKNVKENKLKCYFGDIF